MLQQIDRHTPHFYNFSSPNIIWVRLRSLASFPFQAEHLDLPIHTAPLTTETHEFVCRNKYSNEETKLKPAFSTKSKTVPRTFLYLQKLTFRLGRRTIRFFKKKSKRIENSRIYICHLNCIWETFHWFFYKQWNWRVSTLKQFLSTRKSLVCVNLLKLLFVVSYSLLTFWRRNYFL
jgi:hypothetical protein